MVEQSIETMPEDVRQSFANAIRLYSRWRFASPGVSAPTLGFRTIKVSLSGVCDLVPAYKNELLPVAIHDELWTLIEDMKLKDRACYGPVLCDRCANSGCTYSAAPVPPRTRNARRFTGALVASTRPQAAVPKSV